jgi:hypothetical protein
MAGILARNRTRISSDEPGPVQTGLLLQCFTLKGEETELIFIEALVEATMSERFVGWVRRGGRSPWQAVAVAASQTEAEQAASAWTTEAGWHVADVVALPRGVEPEPRRPVPTVLRPVG